MQQPTFDLYARFQAEDFVQDAYFQHWVFSADGEANGFWSDFLHIYPHQVEAVKAARVLLGQIQYRSHSLPQARQEAILKQVYAEAGNRKRSYRIFQKSYLAAVASVSLVMVSVLVWLFYPAYETYATGFRETRTITLADGSEVTLNANTTIRVDINTEENQPRQVWLEGEAYFQVAHLSDEKTALHPALEKFVVHTDNFDIEVLGTVFNASNRERQSKVYLQEGKVKVASEKIAQSQVLEPGDQLALSEEDEAFAIIKAAKDTAPAWQENYFIFQNTPLEEVARKIENYYGLEVTFTDSGLAEKIFTAKVSRDQLPMLLEAIKASFGVRVTREDNKIRIRP